NTFHNEAAGNDPAVNFQRAIIVTSHSSPTTLVLYDANHVDGANIGIAFQSGFSFAGNQAVVLTGNSITSCAAGIYIGSQGIAHLENNVITASGAFGGVHVFSGTLTGAGGNPNGLFHNAITGGAGDGVWIETLSTSAPIAENDLSGNVGFGLRNE